jgi:hypothetical protein
VKSINPLNVLGQREVTLMPKHFTVVYYDLPMWKASRSTSVITEHMRNWIFNNLDGRFFVHSNGIHNPANTEEQDKYKELDHENICYRFSVGFEIPEESTFFSLAYQGDL